MHATYAERVDDAPEGRPEPVAPAVEPLRPVQVPMVRIVQVGTAAWLLALVVVLLVPALHEGERDWWPWCCVAGAGLGLLGWGYLRRGRGNARL